MNSEGRLAVGFMEKPYKIIKADAGGIKFTIVSSERWRPVFSFHLLTKECTHEEAFSFSLSENSCLFDVQANERKNFKVPNFNNVDTRQFWLTWYNDVICLGHFNEPPLLTYAETNITVDKELIGFLKFETYSGSGGPVEWNVESAPVIYEPFAPPKPVSGGELRWVRMDSTCPLPVDALIGGLEGEPTYIARAAHRGSLCPGKYVKSKQRAFIPWGHEEISKTEFEILCGYDAVWVNCSDTRIPENAYVGGYSEVNHEPLFIGRAWVRDNLVIGKVHMLYKTCFLPFERRELERTEYQTLVVGNHVERGETCDTHCFLNMNIQPCT